MEEAATAVVFITILPDYKANESMANAVCVWSLRVVVRLVGDDTKYTETLFCQSFSKSVVF